MSANFDEPAVNRETPPSAERAEFRVDRLKRAALSSIAPKATTLLMQLLALPIAARTLGTTLFALYVITSAAMMWLNLATAAIFPGFVTRASAIVVRGDVRAERRLISSALALTLGLSAVMIVAAVAVLTFATAADLWGAQYADAPMNGLVLLFVGSALLGILVSVVEGAQLAHHEQHVTNYWNAAGNIAGFVALLLVAWFHSGLLLFVFAVQVVPQFGRVVNAWIFFARAHPQLTPSARVVSGDDVRLLARRGGGFALVAVGGFLNHQLPLVILGRYAPPVHVAVFGALMNAFLLAFGVLSMFTTAVWPALADAHGRGEYAWAAALCRRAAGVGATYGVLGGVFLIVAGELLVQRWYGLPMRVGTALRVWLGLYFVAAVWEHVLYNLLVGLHHLRQAIFPYTARSLVVLLALPFAVRAHAAVGIAAVLALSALASTVWFYPLALRRELRVVARRGAPPPDPT